MGAGESKTFLFDWERIVRAARISSNAKLVAFCMKGHANLDGTKSRPSTALLMVEANLSYSAVTRARAELIKAGLIILTRRGNRHKRRADEYRLILAEDLDERLVWLSPSEMKAAAVKLSDERQAAETARVRKKSSGVSGSPELDQKPAEVQDSHRVRRASSGLSQSPGQDSHRPPTISSDQSRPERPSQSVGNATHHPRATETEPEIDHGGSALTPVPDTKRTGTKPPPRPARPGRGRQLPLVAAITPEPDEDQDDTMRPHLRELLDRPTDRPTTPTATGPTCTHCDVVLDPDQQCRNPACHPTAPPTTAAPAVDECACGVLLDPGRICRNPTHASTG